jgi:hypothetical protein
MTAPLPLRMKNPVKKLCETYHMDYEKVIGETQATRDAFINAEFPLNPTEMNSKTRNLVKHKTDYYNRKYGSPNNQGSGNSETEDKGILRYQQGLIVEHILPDVSGNFPTKNISSHLGSIEDVTDAEVKVNELITHKKGSSIKRPVWVPGKGVKVPGSN